MGSNDQVEAVAIAHPGGILSIRMTLKNVTKPSLFLCAEHDHLFPTEHIEGGKKILDKQGVWNKFVIYKGTQHGFAV
jgi:dienelactone hydrolase